MSDTAIAVEHLSKRYRLGGRQKYRTLRDSLTDAFAAPFRRRAKSEESAEAFWALDDVSFSIKHGEVVGIIGRNGAGKSTLLKVLSRITEPTKGEVRVHGRVASLLEVGTGFHPELSGRDNIYLNGAILGMKKAEIRRKFDEIVAFAEVEKFIDTAVKHYSSGMYVRLAFAVAAHLEPEILVIDEVLAVGDAQFQKKCLGKIGDVARHGRTVLFVSHNMAPIKQLCSRALVMRKGQLVCDSDADSGIEFYIQSAGTVDIDTIRDRAEREGNGRIRFTGVDLADEFGEKDTVFRSGQDCQMILHYRCPDGQPKAGVIAAIAIMDQMGTCLLHHRTNFANENFSWIPPEGSFVCRIPRFNLAPGLYTVAIFCAIDEQPCDLLREAFTLTVEPGDFYGTRHQGQANLCRVLTECHWTLESPASDLPFDRVASSAGERTG